MANLDSRVSALERSLGEPEPVEINVNMVTPKESLELSRFPKMERKQKSRTRIILFE